MQQDLVDLSLSNAFSIAKLDSISIKAKSNSAILIGLPTSQRKAKIHFYNGSSQNKSSCASLLAAKSQSEVQRHVKFIVELVSEGARNAPTIFQTFSPTGSQFIVKNIYSSDSEGAHTAISCNSTFFGANLVKLIETQTSQRNTMVYFNDGSSWLIVGYIYSLDSEGARFTRTTFTITQALDCQRLIVMSIRDKIPLNFHNEQIVFREGEWERQISLAGQISLVGHIGLDGIIGFVRQTGLVGLVGQIDSVGHIGLIGLIELICFVDLNSLFVQISIDHNHFIVATASQLIVVTASINANTTASQLIVANASGNANTKIPFTAFDRRIVFRETRINGLNGLNSLMASLLMASSLIRLSRIIGFIGQTRLIDLVGLVGHICSVGHSVINGFSNGSNGFIGVIGLVGHICLISLVSLVGLIGFGLVSNHISLVSLSNLSGLIEFDKFNGFGSLALSASVALLASQLRSLVDVITRFGLLSHVNCISLLGSIGFSGISGLADQISLIRLSDLAIISLVGSLASFICRLISLIGVIGLSLIASSVSIASLARRLISFVSLVGSSIHRLYHKRLTAAVIKATKITWQLKQAVAL
jgi:hypothetical protein